MPGFIFVGRLLVLHRLEPDATGHCRVLAGLAEGAGCPVECARDPSGRIRLRVQLL